MHLELQIHSQYTYLRWRSRCSWTIGKLEAEIMFRNLLNSDFLCQTDVALRMTGLTQTPQENGICISSRESQPSAKTVLEYNERLKFKSIVEIKARDGVNVVRHSPTK